MLRLPTEVEARLYKQAELTVLDVRGSDDVPGYYACVASEFANLRAQYVKEQNKEK